MGRPTIKIKPSFSSLDGGLIFFKIGIFAIKAQAILIIGINTGLGFQTALELVKKDTFIIMAEGNSAKIKQTKFSYMKNSIFKSKIWLLFLLFSIVTSCNSQSKTNSKKKEEINTTNQLSENENSQIDEYVTGIFEDTKGNLWFSTLSKGVAKYDGNKLIYETSMGNRVGSIVEDSDANLWFGTHAGVYKFDGKQFTNFKTTKDGNTFSKPIMSILEDSKGNIWLGCAGGLFSLDSDGIINVTTNGPWSK